MHAQPLRFDVAMTLEDLELIRRAIRAWGKPADVAEQFDGAALYGHYERWEQFVETDWANGDITEYDHDIGCRTWIQVAIEHSTPLTAVRLRRAVQPVDDAFQVQMKPCREVQPRRVTVLREDTYFWQTHTIHPELV